MLLDKDALKILKDAFNTLWRVYLNCSASMGGYDYDELECSNYEPLTKTLA